MLRALVRVLSNKTMDFESNNEANQDSSRSEGNRKIIVLYLMRDRRDSGGRFAAGFEVPSKSNQISGLGPIVKDFTCRNSKAYNGS